MKKKLIVPLALVLAMLLCMPAMAATVCKIGSKGYGSLQEAINNVKDGQTIKVTKVIKATEMVVTYKDIPNQPRVYPKFTIDFKKKKYTYRGFDYAFRIGSSAVTFKNINFDVQRGIVFRFNGQKGSLVITGGKYSGGTIATILAQDKPDAFKLTIKKGTFNQKSIFDAAFTNYGTLIIN